MPVITQAGQEVRSAPVKLPMVEQLSLTPVDLSAQRFTLGADRHEFR